MATKVSTVKTYTMADLDAAFASKDEMVKAMATDVAMGDVYAPPALAARLVVSVPYGGFTTLGTHRVGHTHPAATEFPVRYRIPEGSRSQRDWEWCLGDLLVFHAAKVAAWESQMAADLADSRGKAVAAVKAQVLDDIVKKMRAMGMDDSAIAEVVKA